MKQENLSRREFLAITAVMLEAAYLGWPMTAGASVNAAPVDLSELSARIGEHYLALYPAEKDIARLSETLHFDGKAAEAQIKTQLRDDIHGDFADHRTFRYAGWLFSQTEGRLCAYKALNK